MERHSGRSYKRYANALYRLYSFGLSALSHVKPLFRFALRVLTSERRELSGRILPLNTKLGSPAQTPLGRDALEHLIERSTAVGAMNECMCRAVGGCRDYPADLGCLVLGDAVKSLHPSLGRAVERSEAMAIVDRALGLGLVPMVIHLKSDAMLWSLEHSRMLTVCFCCPCHCLIQKALAAQKRPKEPRAKVLGLPGVAVRLDANRCVGCGQCVFACFTGAMSVENGKAAVDAGKCLACGRCAMGCARGALVVEAQECVDAGALLREEYGKQTEEDSVFLNDRGG